MVTQPLMPLRMCAALYKSHPLSGRESVSIEELREEPIIWWRRSSAPVVYDAIQSACAGQGFVPKVTETKNSPYDVLLSVAAGQGVGFLMDEIAHMGERASALCPSMVWPLTHTMGRPIFRAGPTPARPFSGMR